MRFLIGIICGAFAVSGLWVLSEVDSIDTGNTIRSTTSQILKSIGHTASEYEYDYCKTNYFKQSSCLQKFKQGICEKQIQKKCGTNPNLITKEEKFN